MSIANPVDIKSTTQKNGTGSKYSPILNERGEFTISQEAGTVADNRKTVTTAGTAVQLAAAPCKKIIVQSETDNTGIIAVGTSTVVAAEGTQRGAILFAGDSVELEVSNADLLYIDSTVNGEGVSYTYLI